MNNAEKLGKLVAWPLRSPGGAFGRSGTAPRPGRPGPLSAGRVLIPWLFPPFSIWKHAHVHTTSTSRHTHLHMRDHTQTFDWGIEVVGIPRCLYHGSYGGVLQFGGQASVLLRDWLLCGRPSGSDLGDSGMFWAMSAPASSGNTVWSEDGGPGHGGGLFHWGFLASPVCSGSPSMGLGGSLVGHSWARLPLGADNNGKST